MKKIAFLLFLLAGIAMPFDGKRCDREQTVVVAKKAFRNQTGPIPQTTLFIPKTDGDYRASVYVEAADLTARPPNGDLVVTVEWTDDIRETCAITSTTGPVATLDYWNTAVIHAIANHPIVVSGYPTACSYGTTDLTDSYNAFVTIEELP